MPKINFPYDSNIDYTNEMYFLNETIHNWARSNTGSFSYTSTTSGITYSTDDYPNDPDIYNKGELGFIHLLWKLYGGKDGWMILADDHNSYLRLKGQSTTTNQLSTKIMNGYNKTIYPLTHEDYVIDNNGKKLSDTLNEIETAVNANRRFTTVVVGSSTAGYIADQVDYLCNGTNDTTQLQAALTYLNSRGGRLIILNGIYTISSTLNISQSVIIEGLGSSTVLNGTTSDIFSINGSNVIIRNMKFNITQASAIISTGTYADILIDNISIAGGSTSTAKCINLTNINRVKITHSSFNLSFGTNIDLTSVSNCILFDNRMVSNDTTTISTANIIISSCSSVIIDNNSLIVLGSSGRGIIINSCNSVIINNNNINSSYGGISQKNSEKILATNSTFVASSPFNTNAVNYSIIANSTLYGTGSAATISSGPVKGIVSNNNVSGEIGSSIEFGSSLDAAVVCAQNTIDAKTKASAITCVAKNCNIINNNVKTDGFYSIYLYANSANCIVSTNLTIDKPITNSGTNNTLYNNKS